MAATSMQRSGEMGSGWQEPEFGIHWPLPIPVRSGNDAK